MIARRFLNGFQPPITSSSWLYYFKMKRIILFFLIFFFIIVSATVIHELVHQYKFSEINEVCFFGYSKEEGSVLESSFGWNKADSYWYREEKIPRTIGFVYIGFVTLTLTFVFRKELAWW